MWRGDVIHLGGEEKAQRTVLLARMRLEVVVFAYTIRRWTTNEWL